MTLSKYEWFGLAYIAAFIAIVGAWTFVAITEGVKFLWWFLLPPFWMLGWLAAVFFWVEVQMFFKRITTGERRVTPPDSWYSFLFLKILLIPGMFAWYTIDK